jgi:site-specific DNA recombinase
MIDAASYLRKSTDRQEQSIPDQRAAVQAYAKKHGYRIVREYKDEGISGDDTEKRLQFQRMRIDAGERGDFQVILCWDQDRFGRFDTLDAGFWIKPFRDAGVRLETIAQGPINWDDFAGRIVYAVQQEGKHAFLRDLSRNSTRGKIRAAREGKWLGGAAPYSYTLRDQRLVPGEPEKVAVVKELFERYARTPVGLRKLAEDLNTRGVASPSGGQWSLTAVRTILKNPVYCGRMVWNRRHEGKYYGVAGGELEANGRGKRHRNPEEDYIVVEGTHEALIDAATFAEVQRKLMERRRLTAPLRGFAYRLSGLVICGHCGCKMHGRTYRRRKRNHPGHYVHTKYKCSGYQTRGRTVCQNNVVHERPLLDCVIRKLQEDFLNPENLTKLRAEIRRRVRTNRGDDPAQAKRLRQQIADLDRRIDQGNERFLTAPADLAEGLAAKLREWRGQRDKLQAVMESLGAPKRQEAGDLEAKVDRAMDMLHRLQEALHKADPARLREVIGHMVAKVECWFEHVRKVKRTDCELSRGLIHLRLDVAVIRVVLHATTRLTAGFEFIGPPLPRRLAAAVLGA